MRRVSLSSACRFFSNALVTWKSKSRSLWNRLQRRRWFSDWLTLKKSNARRRELKQLIFESLELRQVMTANAGTLDPLYGDGNGYVVTDISQHNIGGVTDQYGTAMETVVDLKTLPDGKTIAAGWGLTYEPAQASYLGDFVVAKYNEDGSLDDDFGNDGVVVAHLDGHDRLYGMTVDEYGSIYLVGSGNNFQDALVLKYSNSGILDTSFGASGILSVDFGMGYGQYFLDIEIDSNGKLVLLGTAYQAVSGVDLAIARIDSSGALDTSFSDDGLFVAITASYSHPEYYPQLVLDSSNNIYATGITHSVSMSSTVKVTSSGTLETGFGTNGVVTTTFGGETAGTSSIVMDDAGNLIIAGSVTASVSSNLVFAKLNSTTGALVTSFGNNGIAIYDTGSNVEWVSDLAYQASTGKISFSGTTGTSNDTIYSILGGRLNSNGSLDAAFGPDGNGLIVLSLGTYGGDGGTAIELAPTGNVIIGGELRNGYWSNFTLVQLLSDAPIAAADPEFQTIAHTGETQIDLGEYFTDETDSDDQLVYEVVGISYPALFSNYNINGQILTLDFNWLVANSTITVSATDSSGQTSYTDLTIRVDHDPTRAFWIEPLYLDSDNFAQLYENSDVIYAYAIRRAQPGPELWLNLSFAGTATYDSDYYSTESTWVLFPEGNTIHELALGIIDDNLFDNGPGTNEDIIASIVPGSGYTIGYAAGYMGTDVDNDPGIATAMIADNDYGDTQFWIETDNSEYGNHGLINEGDTAQTAFIVRRENPGVARTVYVTFGGQAVYGEDYTDPNSYATAVYFDAGVTEVRIGFSIVDDGEYEGGPGTYESITATLNSGWDYSVGYPGYQPESDIDGDPSTANAYIEDNDYGDTQFWIEACYGQYGNGGEVLEEASTIGYVPPLFVIQRANPGPARTVYVTFGGDAVYGEDYTDPNGYASAVYFPDGQKTVYLHLGIIDDTLHEALDDYRREAIQVTINAGSDYTVGYSSEIAALDLDYDPATAYSHIRDNDIDTVFWIEASYGSIAEGTTPNGEQTPVFVIRRENGGPARNILVNLTGAATYGEDYVDVNNYLNWTVFFPENATSVTLDFSIVDDAISESNETFTASLMEYGGYTISSNVPNLATTAILDDDDVTFWIEAVTAGAAEEPFSEHSSSNGQYQTRFAVYRENSGPARYVNLSFGGSAEYGVDYLSNVLSVYFSAGQTVAYVDLFAYDDENFEGDESITVTLLPSLDYSIGYSPEVAVNDPDSDPAFAAINFADNDVGDTTFWIESSYGQFGNGGLIPEGISVNENIPVFAIHRLNPGEARTLYVTLGGNATFGEDYTDPNGYATAIYFPAGATTYWLYLDVTQDEVYEGGYWTSNEAIQVTLNEGSDYTIGYNGSAFTHVDPDGDPATAYSYIADDDYGDTTFWIEAYGSGGQGTSWHNEGVTPNGETTPSFRIHRQGPGPGRWLGVNFAGAATYGEDYLDVNGYSSGIYFPDGVTSLWVDFNFVNDTIYEQTEDFTLTLTEGSDYSIDTNYSSATVEIFDDDSDTTFWIEAVSSFIQESVTPNGEQTPVFVIRRENSGAARFINVSFAGAAVYGEDYSDVNSYVASVYFPEGVTSVTLDFSIVDDANFELTETFTATLLDYGDDYSLRSDKPATATTDILDDDDVTFWIEAVTTGAAEEPFSEHSSPSGQYQTRFAVHRENNGPARAVALNFGGSAEYGVDYDSFNTVVYFAAGETVAYVDLRAYDDTYFEGDESIIVTLSAGMDYAVGYSPEVAANDPDGDPATATINLADDDVGDTTFWVEASYSDYGSGSLVREGISNEGYLPLVFAIRRQYSGEARTLYVTFGGSAIYGVDYTDPSDFATAVYFPAGETTVFLNFGIVDDEIYEGGFGTSNENIQITLNPDANYSIGYSSELAASDPDGDPATANAWITDNDYGDTTFAIQGYGNSGGGSPVNESSTPYGEQTAVFAIYRQNPGPARYLSVSFAGAAIYGEDYLDVNNYATSGVYFPDGETVAYLTFMIVNDAIYEHTEDIYVTLYEGSGYSVTGGMTMSATTDIVDDDDDTTFWVDVAYQDYGGIGNLGEGLSPSGETYPVFAVRRESAGAARTVHLSFSGSATYGEDYVSIYGTDIYFEEGQTVAYINMSIVDDGVYEGGPGSWEDILVTLESGYDYDIGYPEYMAMSDPDGNPATASSLIFDNDYGDTEFWIEASHGQYGDGGLVHEGISANGYLPPVFAIRRENPGPARTLYVTFGGDAVYGADYTDPNNYATAVYFPEGETTVYLNLGVADDLLTEGGPERYFESIQVTLNAGENYTVGYSSERAMLDPDYAPQIANSYISDNDYDTTFWIEAASSSISENATPNGETTPVFVIRRQNGGPGLYLNVSFAGAVIKDEDYLDVNNYSANPYYDNTSRIYFPEGANSVTIDFNIINDDIYESTEDFTASLIEYADYNLSTTMPTTATNYIVDDDDDVAFWIENNFGGGTGRLPESASSEGVWAPFFAVRREHAGPAKTVYFEFSGSATYGVDYSSLTGTEVYFEAGQTVAYVELSFIDDSIYEGGSGSVETIIVSLQPNAEYSIGYPSEVAANDPDGNPAVAIGEIEDNEPDTAPTTSGISNVSWLHTATAPVIDLYAAFADAEDSDELLVYTIESNSNSALFNNLSIDAGKLYFGYDGTHIGTSEIKIRATDHSGNSVEAIFAAEVLSTYLAIYDPTTKVLTVSPGNGNHLLVLNADNGKLTINDLDQLFVNPVEGNASASQISAITLAQLTVIGTAENDELNISAINTTLFPVLTRVAINGGEGDDLILGSQLNDTLNGGEGNDTLYGYDGRDTILGGSGNDLIEGGKGDDVLVGNQGDDVYMYDGITALGNDNIIELSADAGIDTLNFSSFSYVGQENVVQGIVVDLSSSASSSRVNDGLTLNLTNASGLENVIGTEFNDQLTGNSLNNTLTGGLGNDLLEGNAGEDTLGGGAGDDTYKYRGSTNPGIDAIVEIAADSGTDTIDFRDLTYTQAGITLDLAALASNSQLSVSATNSQQKLVLNLSNAYGLENVIGTAYNDVISGNSRNNVLEGAGGADQLQGRAGEDRYVYAGTDLLGADQITEVAESGGPTARNILDFSGFAYQGQGVSIDLSHLNLSGAVINSALKLTINNTDYFDTIYGTAYNDFIIGNQYNNQIYGNRGDDKLGGFAGVDALSGGTGNDEYIFSGLPSFLNYSVTINESDYQGTDTLDFSQMNTGVTVDLSKNVSQGIAANVTAILSDGTAIENVIGSNYNDTISGNSLDNIIDARDGDDTIDSDSDGDGNSDENDILTGGAGNNSIDGEQDNQTPPNAIDVYPTSEIIVIRKLEDAGSFLLNLDKYFHIPENVSLSYETDFTSNKAQNTGSLFQDPINKGSTVVLKSNDNKYGNAILEVNASYQEGEITKTARTLKIKFEVESEAELPALTKQIGVVNYAEDTQPVDTVVKLSDYFTDKNDDSKSGDRFSYQVTSIDDSGKYSKGTRPSPVYSYSVDDKGNLQLHLATDTYGYQQFAVTATIRGKSAATTFWVNVTPENDNPISRDFSDESYSGYWYGWYGRSRDIPVVKNMASYFWDVELGSKLIYEVTVTGEGSIFRDAPEIDGRGFLRYSIAAPTKDQQVVVGEATITVKAKDSNGSDALSVEESYTVNVDRHDYEEDAEPDYGYSGYGAYDLDHDGDKDVFRVSPDVSLEIHLADDEKDPSLRLDIDDQSNGGGYYNAYWGGTNDSDPAWKFGSRSDNEFVEQQTQIDKNGDNVTSKYLVPKLNNDNELLLDNTSYYVNYESDSYYHGSISINLTMPQSTPDTGDSDDYFYSWLDGTLTINKPSEVDVYVPSYLYGSKSANVYGGYGVYWDYSWVKYQNVAIQYDYEQFNNWSWFSHWSSSGTSVPILIRSNGSGSAINAEITATYTSATDDFGGHTEDSDSATITVAKLDVDTDSDDSAEALEDLIYEPGKVIYVNTGDDDFDGIIDMYDGFNGDSYDKETKADNALDDTNDEASGFTPIVITLPEGYDPERARIRFSYSSNDPQNAISYNSFTEENYRTQQWGIRLWTKDESDARNAHVVTNDREDGDESGHFIAPYYDYYIKDFTSDDTLTIYVEGISAGYYSVDVAVDPDGLSKDYNQDDSDKHIVNRYGYIHEDSVKIQVISEVSIASTDKYGSYGNNDSASFTISRQQGDVSSWTWVYYRLGGSSGGTYDVDAAAGEIGKDFQLNDSYYGYWWYGNEYDKEMNIGRIAIPAGTDHVQLLVTPVGRINDDNQSRWDKRVTIQLIEASDYWKYFDEAPADGKVPTLDVNNYYGYYGYYGNYGYNYNNYGYYNYNYSSNYLRSNFYALSEDDAKTTATVTLLGDNEANVNVTNLTDTGTTQLAPLSFSNSVVDVAAQDGELRFSLGFGNTVLNYNSADNLIPMVNVEMTIPWQEANAITSLEGTINIADIDGSQTNFALTGVDQYLADNPLGKLSLTLVSTTEIANKIPTGTYDISIQFKANVNGTIETKTVLSKLTINNRVNDEQGQTEFGQRWNLDGLSRIHLNDGYTYPASGKASETTTASSLGLFSEGIQPSSGATLIRGDGTATYYAATPIFKDDSKDQNYWLRFDDKEDLKQIEISKNSNDPGFVTYSDYGYWWWGYSYNNSYKYSPAGKDEKEETVTWSYDNLDKDKLYQVFVSYLVDPDNASNAAYTVTGKAFGGKAGEQQILVNQQYGENDYSYYYYGQSAQRSIGYFQPDEDGKLTIKLSTKIKEDEYANGIVVAGDVRLADDWKFTAPTDSFTKLVYGNYESKGTGDYYQNKDTDEPAKADGKFTLFDKYGNRSTYDTQGLLTLVKDRNENRIEFKYEDKDDDGRADELTQITTQGGLSTTLKYSEDGYLSEIEDFAGRVTKVSIEGGALKSFELPDPESGAATPITKLDYQALAGGVSGLSEITNARGDKTVIGYNSTLGRVDKVTNPDSTGNAHAGINGDGNTELRQWQVISAWASAFQADNSKSAVQRLTSGNFEYFNDEFTEQVVTYTDARNQAWRYQVDQRGLEIASTTPYFQSENAQTEADHNAIWRTIRDPRGYAIKSIAPAGGGGAANLSAQETEYVYDYRGNLTKITYAQQKLAGGGRIFESWGYNTQSFNALVSHTTKAGLYNNYVLDDYGNVKSSTIDGVVTTYEYYDTPTAVDQLRGGLLKQSSVGSLVTKNEYYQAGSDRVGLLEKSTVGLGSEAPQVTLYEYDSNRNLEKTTQVMGKNGDSDRITEYRYDNTNLLAWIQEPAPETGDHIAAKTQYRYDDLGLLIKTIDAKLKETDYEYDGMGRLVKTTLPVAGGSPRQTPQERSYSESRYDENGNLVKKLDNYGVQSTTEYDERNLVKSVTSPTPTASFSALGAADTVVAAVVKYTYDVLGQLKQSSDPRSESIVTKYYYDSLGRQTKSTLPVSGTLDAQIPGTEYVYEDDGLVKQVKTAHTDGTLTRITDYNYDGYRRLSSVLAPADVNGARPTTSYYYTALNQVDFVVENGSSITDYQYDVFGNISSVEYPDPYMNNSSKLYVSYKYNQANQLLETTWSSEGNTSTSRTSTTKYDNLGRVIETNGLDPDGAGPLSGALTKYHYDINGNLNQTEQKFEDIPDQSAQYLTVNTEHDNLNRPWKTTTSQSIAEVGTPETLIGYDLRGQMTSVMEKISENPSTTYRVTSYGYDELGRSNSTSVQVTSYGLDNSTTEQTLTSKTLYDAAGNVRFTEDSRGYVTENQYDNYGRVTKTILPAVSTTDLGTTTPTYQYKYFASGELQKTIDPQLNETSYIYDLLGRVVSTTLPAVNGSAPVLTAIYDLFGNLEEKTDAQGNRTKYDVDSLGQVWGVSQAGPTGNFTSLGSAIYNAFGEVTQSTDAIGTISKFIFDRAGRMVSSQTGTDPEAISTYDSGNILRKFTDSQGQVIKYGFDNLLRQNSVTDGNGKTSSVAMDLLGNQTKFTDADGNVTTYKLDELGRVVKETQTLGSNELSRRYVYDKNGNLEQYQDRDGRIKSWVYDSHNRAVTEIWYEDANAYATAEVQNVKNWFYDSNARLKSAGDSNGLYTYDYDNRDRLLSTTIDLWPTMANPAGDTITLVNDYTGRSDGLRKKLTVSLNGTQNFFNNYDYDTNLNLSQVNQTSTANGSTVERRVDLKHKADGRLESLERFYSLDESDFVSSSKWSYDTEGRLLELAHRTSRVSSSGGPLSTYGLTYDNAGRLQTLNISQRLNIPEAVSYDTRTYGYDALNQLLSVTSTGTDSESYTYDDNGNRLTANGSTYTAPNAGDHNRLSNDGQFSYEYDSEGHRTVKQRLSPSGAEDDRTTYAWDVGGRLTKVQQYSYVSVGSGYQLTKEINYTYDVWDQLIGRTVTNYEVFEGVSIELDTTTESYIWESGHLILQRDDQGRVTQRYLYGSQVDQVLAIEFLSYDGEGIATSKLAWVLADQQGSVRELYDNYGNRLLGREFDSFGNILSEDRDENFTAEVQPAYTGRWWDAEAQLYQYRARWYDARIGQFISADPIEDDRNNTYRYVGNSAPNATDPSGLADETNQPGTNVNRDALNRSNAKALEELNLKIRKNIRENYSSVLADWIEALNIRVAMNYESNSRQWDWLWGYQFDSKPWENNAYHYNFKLTNDNIEFFATLELINELSSDASMKVFKEWATKQGYDTSPPSEIHGTTSYDQKLRRDADFRSYAALVKKLGASEKYIKSITNNHNDQEDRIWRNEWFGPNGNAWTILNSFAFINAGQVTGPGVPQLMRKGPDGISRPLDPGAHAVPVANLPINGVGVTLQKPSRLAFQPKDILTGSILEAKFELSKGWSIKNGPEVASNSGRFPLGETLPGQRPIGSPLVEGHHNAIAIVTGKDGKVIPSLTRQLISGESNPASFERLISGRRYRATDTEARLAVRIRLQEGETMTILGQQGPCSTCKGWMKNAAGAYKAKYVYQWWENGSLNIWETYSDGNTVRVGGN